MEIHLKLIETVFHLTGSQVIWETGLLGVSIIGYFDVVN